MDKWACVAVLDKAPRSASQSPPVSKGAMAAALCSKRPETALIGGGGACERAGEGRSGGEGARARDCISSHARVKRG